MLCDLKQNTKPLWGKKQDLPHRLSGRIKWDNTLKGLGIALGTPESSLSVIVCLQRELSFYSRRKNTPTLACQLKISFHFPHMTNRLLWLFSHPHSAWLAGWMTVQWGKTDSALNGPAHSQHPRRGAADAPALCSRGLDWGSPPWVWAWVHSKPRQPGTVCL